MVLLPHGIFSCHRASFLRRKGFRSCPDAYFHVTGFLIPWSIAIFSRHLSPLSRHFKILCCHLSPLCCHFKILCRHFSPSCCHFKILSRHLSPLSRHLSILFCHRSILFCHFRIYYEKTRICMDRCAPCEVPACMSWSTRRLFPGGDKMAGSEGGGWVWRSAETWDDENSPHCPRHASDMEQSGHGSASFPPAPCFVRLGWAHLQNTDRDSRDTTRPAALSCSFHSRMIRKRQ
jgi:hypothetical protein